MEMTTTQPFTGPRGALLWQYGRALFWLAVLGAPVSAYAGYRAGRDSDWVYFATLVAFFIAILVAAQLKTELGFRSFQWRLPVTSRTVAHVELGLIVTLFLWFLLSYAVAYRLSSPEETYPTPWCIPYMTVVGFSAVIFSRSFDAVAIAAMVLGLGVPAIGVSVAYLDTADESQTLVTSVLVAILCLGYGATVYGTYIMRHGGRQLEEKASLRLESLVAAARRGSGLEQVSATVASVPPPLLKPHSSRHQQAAAQEARRRCNDTPAWGAKFASPVEAQAWYELQAFRNPLWWFYRVMAIPYCFLFASVIREFIPGDPFAVRFACLLSVMLWLNWHFTGREPFMNPLPVSDWTRTWVRFRLSWPALAILGPMRWLLCSSLLLALALTWMDASYTAYASFSGSILLLGTILWVGWISLALGIPFFATLMLATCYGLIGEPPATAIGVVMVALYLWFIVADQCGFRRRALSPSGALCLLSTGLVLAGYFLLPLFSLSPLTHWTVREGLGTLLVLAMLHHHQVHRVIPEASVRQLRQALLGGVAGLWLIVAVLGPPVGPDTGITAMYVAFGVVPPLFFPFLLVPYQVQVSHEPSDDSEE